MAFYRRVILKLMSLGFFNWMPDRLYLNWKFKLVLGYSLDLKNPKTFNEKLNWLKLYDFKAEYTTYVDKYLVREYIKKTIGEEYLIPLVGIYNSIAEVKPIGLPDRFVLKCTSGSGGNIICKNKSSLDFSKSIKKLKKFLRQNYFYLNREYPYKSIKPKFVCEEFISDTEITPDDYKVYCFNGKARLLEFHIDRFGETEHTCDYYDEHLNRLDFAWGTTPSDIELPHKNLAVKLIELSEKIAAHLLHARVDWYIVGEKIYFGEITLYNGGGFEKFNSYDDDLLLGSWLRLPIDNKNGER